MTVLQQSHLCPVPLESQAVYWQYDHALHLYPAPDLVVLADSAASAQFVFKDTACANPVGIQSAMCIAPLLSMLLPCAGAQPF